jgi:hypothetical protein
MSGLIGARKAPLNSIAAVSCPAMSEKYRKSFRTTVGTAATLPRSMTDELVGLLPTGSGQGDLRPDELD